MTATLLALAAIFAELSLLAFGGGNTILPEMQRQVVDVHQWMSAREFTALFALAQAAPGPNMMVVTLVGWRVAGLPGAIVCTLAKFGPCTVLTALLLRIWDRFKQARWRPLVQAGIAPVTVGLVAASAVLITEASNRASWSLYAITALVTLFSLRTRIHPLWLLAGGGLGGLAGVWFV